MNRPVSGDYIFRPQFEFPDNQLFILPGFSRPFELLGLVVQILRPLHMFHGFRSLLLFVIYHGQIEMHAGSIRFQLQRPFSGELRLIPLFEFDESRTQSGPYPCIVRLQTPGLLERRQGTLCVVLF